MYTSIILLIFALLGGCSAAMYDCPTCMKMRVGKAEYVTGPLPAPLDNPFFSLSTSSGVYGYSANGDTNVVVKGTINNTLTPFSTALKCGDAGKFDECGSWLNSAFADDGGIIRAWYHSECKCNYDIGQTVKSVAYAESRDGGATFTKLNYPYNQVITGTSPPTAGIPVGNGDHTVIDGGDGFYYMFFINWDNWGHNVARASTSSGGKPGSWLKYYQGKWTESGLGGKSSSINNLLASTVSKHFSGNLIYVSSGVGINLGIGSDPLTWKTVPDPLVFTEQSQWVRSSSSTELFAYPSMVPLLGGNAPLGNSFYLYYTYLPPGLGYDKRYLIRRVVSLSQLSAPDGFPQAGVELSRYTNGTVSWSTTTLPLGAVFKYSNSLGYVLTAQYANTFPLYDCYIPLYNSYMPTTYSGDCTGSNGINYLRQLGYIYQNKPTLPATLPLYRCFNANTKKHSISNSAQCEGNGNIEFLMGYVLTN